MSDMTASIPDIAAVRDKVQTAAHAQSEADKAKNFHDAASTMAKKMEEHASDVTREDASHLKSAEAKYTGVAQPPKDSISAAADRLVAANEKAHTLDGAKDDKAEKIETGEVKQ